MILARTRSVRRVAAAPAVLAAMALVAGCDDQGDPPPMPPSPAERPSFDGSSAYELLVEQVDFGPRIPGSPGHAAQLSWMIGRLDAVADTVVTDTFTHTHTGTGEVLTLTNVLARFAPDISDRLLFLAHWDTRPRSDAAETPERRAMPVPGANDGASGVAVLLQVAEHLASDRDFPVGVDILLVDGEDYGPTTDDMFLGATRYATTRAATDGPRYGVLLDMVGDVDPRFPIEGYSADYAPEVAQRVWAVASRLGYGRYFPLEVGQRLRDDHVPLNQVGLPTIDIIDFTYGPGNGYWHTPEDLPEHTSPTTLHMVGELVLELIYSGG